MKKCFKCERDLPLTEYYKHPKMADGHLGKCKDCSKKDAAGYLERNKKDPDWAVREAERCRIKQARARETGRAIKLVGDEKAAVSKRHAEKYPEKDAARRKMQYAIRSGRLIRKPCEVCGNTDSEGHHDDYSKPLDVIWLCPKHHAERHVMLRDVERRKKALERAAQASAA